MTGNHGEYVSGAAHAGIKGKDLAAIAKDVPGRSVQGLNDRTDQSTMRIRHGPISP